MTCCRSTTQRSRAGTHRARTSLRDELYVDGQEVARNYMEHTTPVTFPEDETFDIGQDTRTGVAMMEYRYDVPFKFTGKINKLTFKLEPEPKAISKR